MEARLNSLRTNKNFMKRKASLNQKDVKPADRLEKKEVLRMAKKIIPPDTSVPASAPTPKEPTTKFKIGDIVYVADTADADLNGFKLFPQYKKYTYTIEAYDPVAHVYSLRRLNLLLRLKEVDIVRPSERHSSPLIRKQF